MNDDSGREDRVDDAVRRWYGRTPEPKAEARERLDRALDQLPPPQRERTRARIVAWNSPARYAALAAALVVGIAVGRLGMRPPEIREERVAQEARLGDKHAVQFVLVAPRASNVAVVGDFNGWDPNATPMRRDAGVETWTANVVLEAGTHAYAFVMDGQWVNDPVAPLAPENEFGFRNSVLVVGVPPS